MRYTPIPRQDTTPNAQNVTSPPRYEPMVRRAPSDVVSSPPADGDSGKIKAMTPAEKAADLQRRALSAAPISHRHPPPTAPTLDTVAREVIQRAQYQKLPYAMRMSWEAAGSKDPRRMLRFSGMTEKELAHASPREMIDRYVDSVRKKQGSARAEALMAAINRLLEQDAQTKNASKARADKRRGKGLAAEAPKREQTNDDNNGATEKTLRHPPILPSLPLSDPRKPVDDTSRALKRVAQLATGKLPGSTHLGPQDSALAALCQPLPNGPRPATDTRPLIRTPGPKSKGSSKAKGKHQAPQLSGADSVAPARRAARPAKSFSSTDATPQKDVTAPTPQPESRPTKTVGSSGMRLFRGS